MKKPKRRILVAYKDFLKRAAIGEFDQTPLALIYGRASNFLDDPGDLVALQQDTEEDHLLDIYKITSSFRNVEPLINSIKRPNTKIKTLFAL